MRILTCIFATVACLLLMSGAAVLAQETPSSMGLSLGAHMFSTETPAPKSFGNDLGYGGSVTLNLSDHLGLYTSYDYMKGEGDKDVDQTLAAYLKLGLMKPGKFFAISALGGFEWAAPDFGDFEFDDPEFAFGAMGTLDFTPEVGAYVTATTTLKDGYNLQAAPKMFDFWKLRGGLTYGF